MASIKQYRPIIKSGNKIVVKTCAYDRITRMILSRKTDGITWVTPFDANNARVGGFCVITSDLDVVPIELCSNSRTRISTGSHRSHPRICTTNESSGELIRLGNYWFAPAIAQRIREREQREREQRERLREKRLREQLLREQLLREQLLREQRLREQRFYDEARVHRAIMEQERRDEESFQYRRLAYFAQKHRNERLRLALARRVLTGVNAIPVNIPR